MNIKREKKKEEMSSSTFTQRWTSVNDLTTNRNNNQQLNSFFLQSSSSNSNTLTFTLRPSQSLVSLVEPPSSSSSSSSPPPPPPPPPVPPRPSEQTKPSSSRVADIIHRFESHNKSSMNNNQKKISPPIRSIFTKQWEDKSPQISPIVVVVENPSTNILSNSKKPNKPKPIIVYERITNHERSYKSLSTPPPVSPKSPLAKTWLQNKLISQKTIESDTDSAIQTMTIVINNDTNDLATLSRSSTTDSTCSSSSSFVSPPTPHFALPTIASTHFKRTCSPPPSSVTIFTRPIASINSENNENLPIRSYASEINLVDQYNRLSSLDVSRSDTNLSQNSPTQILINRNLPLRYKRDSFFRLYG